MRTFRALQTYVTFMQDLMDATTMIKMALPIMTLLMTEHSSASYIRMRINAIRTNETP